VSPDEVQKDYIPLGIDPKNPKMMKILLIAAPKNLVQLYINLVKKAGLEPLALETETVALARIVGEVYNFDYPVLVADFGHRGVDMCIVKNKRIVFSQSIGTGSEALSKTLVADFGITIQEADQYKYKVGLLENQLEGKVLRSFIPIMHVINNEIRKLINYFNANFKEYIPQKIILVGEGSKLLGISEYMTKELKIECVQEDPVSKISMSNKLKKEFLPNTTTGFTLAVGLAMKKE
jgi:type IV pilus assembly protein PilM